MAGIDDTRRAAPPHDDLSVLATVGQLVRKLLVLGFILAGAGTSSYLSVYLPLTWYRIQTEFGLTLVVFFGMGVAFFVMALQKFEHHPSPTVRRCARAVGAAFQWLALFIGLVTFVTVMWMIAVVTGQAEAPTGGDFYPDFVVGTAYASCFIFGATGLTYVNAGTGWVRLAALGYAVVGIGAPILALHGPAAVDVLRPMAEGDNGWTAGLVVVVYAMVMSVLGMGLMQLDGRPRRPDERTQRRLEESQARARRGGKARSAGAAFAAVAVLGAATACGDDMAATPVAEQTSPPASSAPASPSADESVVVRHESVVVVALDADLPADLPTGLGESLQASLEANWRLRWAHDAGCRAVTTYRVQTTSSAGLATATVVDDADSSTSSALCEWASGGAVEAWALDGDRWRRAYGGQDVASCELVDALGTTSELGAVGIGCTDGRDAGVQACDLIELALVPNPMGADDEELEGSRIAAGLLYLPALPDLQGLVDTVATTLDAYLAGGGGAAGSEAGIEYFHAEVVPAIAAANEACGNPAVAGTS